MAADILDKFKGCFLGLAVGDALGMPTEGYSSEEIRSRFGPIDRMLPAPVGHFHTGLSAGQYTDDTEETLLLAESMIESSGFSGDRFADKLMEWGSAWVLDERLNRGVGFTTRTAIEQMLLGKPWQESGLDLPTCGSAMRASPIGLLYHCDLDLVSRYAEAQSISTHCGPAARAGSIAIAAGVALCLLGLPQGTILKTAADLCGRVDRELSDRLLWTESRLSLDHSIALEAIGNSPSVYETVPAAFYCFLRLNPVEALISAASGGGDTDSIASMAGALSGAYYGTSWIPVSWLSCLEGRERLELAAKRLAELSMQLWRL